MKVAVIKIELRCSWVHSLKEKRMVVKSITSKLKNRFNISVGEVNYQDVHQKIGIGICFLSLESKQIDSSIENIISFIENNTDAEIVDTDINIDTY